VTKNAKGAFVSIFEEVVFKYAYRSYASKKKDSIILAHTYTRRYTFMAKGHQVRMVIDDQVLGNFDTKTGILSGANTKKNIAMLDKSRPDRWMVKIKNREVASMNRLELITDKGLSKRVFEYVVDGISMEEQAIIMAITIHELVTLAN
jgi:hypothetical protein